MRYSGVTRACTIAAILDEVDHDERACARIFERAGLPPGLLDDPRAVILLADQFALLDAAAHELGDVAIAARVSLKAGVVGLGSYGSMVASQSRLRDALIVGRAMLAVAMQTATRLTLRVDGPNSYWSYQLEQPPVGNRSHNEILAIGYTLGIFRHFCGPKWVPHHLATAAQLGDGLGRIGEVFDCTISRGELTEFAFPTELLECWNRSPLQPVSVDQLPDVDDLSGLVRQAIISGLGEDRPSLAGTAHRLGLSARTLQRRLHEQGQSFARLRDATLKSRALEMIAGGAPMTDVTYRLGFADPSQLSRAFRRWTGEAPSKWREIEACCPKAKTFKYQ